MMRILHDPEPTLRVKSTEMDPGDIQTPETQKLIDEMIETMRKANGVGIAAPQVGVNKRLIVVDDGSGLGVFVNPRLTSRSARIIDFEEGCLSVPGVWGIVKRHKKVHVKALDRTGKKVVLKADGLLSIIFQHEIDHLDGVLFIDRVERLLKGKPAREV